MSKKRPIVAANWKMFKTPEESLSYVEEFTIKILDIERVDVILCVPFTSLFYISKFLKGSAVELGAQNMHWEDEGAYTGEISARMVKSSGAKWVVLGHSERRHIFGEMDKEIAKKVQSAVETNLSPLFCVGETIQEREMGKTEEVLTRQLKSVFGLKEKIDLSQLVIAYEPVWAIGTGIHATPDQVNQAHNKIQDLVERSIPSSGNQVRVLYGGSVKPGNTRELISVDGVNGFLIGGASLNVDTFTQIIKTVEDFELNRG